MEFGIFSNGYIPGPAAHDTESEHTELMRESEYAVIADRNNWKYMWYGEHHGLVEYSHMSAPAPLMGWVAAQTERIHIGSAITSLPVTKEHPVRIAERAAMLDHVTNNRFEFGTGRGAGSHELMTFSGTQPSQTKAMWDEVIREIPRMWEQKDYSFEGNGWSVPGPHNILPKPSGKGHPPIWVACGNPETFAKAGSLGIGAIAFNFEPIHNLKGRLEAYKEAADSPTEIIGQFQNNNVMMTNGVICLEDRERAREIAKARGRGYLVTMVNLYHDTMPKSPDGITWPHAPASTLIEWSDEMLDQIIEAGYMLCGNPEEVSEQLEAYQSVGCDQVVFGLPIEGMQHEEIKEMLEIFGDQVIPEFDKDPVHSTTRMRETAQPKFEAFNNELPPEVHEVTVIPDSSILPLSA